MTGFGGEGIEDEQEEAAESGLSGSEEAMDSKPELLHCNCVPCPGRTSVSLGRQPPI